MNKVIWAFLGILVVSPGFMGCEERSDDQLSRPERKSIASDLEAEKLIKERLDADDQLKAADVKIEVNSQKKLATLSGTVETEALHTKAIELARSVQPELTIEDRIDVNPNEASRGRYTRELAKEEWRKAEESGESVGDLLGDAWIHSKIVAKLIASSQTQQRKINVDVANGEVTLHGSVQYAAQKNEAERIAKDTEGVKRVNNQIEVAA